MAAISSSYNSAYGRRADNGGSPTKTATSPYAYGPRAYAENGGIAPASNDVFAGPNATGAVPKSDVPDEDAQKLWDYVTSFNSSLATQRGNIDRDLTNALGQISQRRNMAGQVIATLPASAQQAYAGVQSAQNASQAAANAALPGDNQNAGAQVLPYHDQALQMNKAGSIATGPLLQLSAQARADSGSNSLRAAAIDAKAAVDAREQEMAFNLLQMQREEKQRKEDAAREDSRYATDWEHQLALRGLDEKAAKTQQPDIRGSGLDSETADSIRQTPAYRYAMASVSEGLDVANKATMGGAVGHYYGAQVGANIQGKKSTYDPGHSTKKLTVDEVLKKYASNPDLVRVLAADLRGPAATGT